MSTPLQEIQAALCRFAAATGYPEPIGATMHGPNGLDVPIPGRASGLPDRLTRNEELVLTAIRSSDEPVVSKTIISITGKARTTVFAALRSLQARGMIELASGDGYREIV